jgi:Ca2+-binding RTX toxin-like protein
VALAVSKTGGDGDNVIKGTPQRDSLSGGGGDDRLYGYGAKDRLYGDSGNDRAFGGGGPDQIYSGQGSDRVRAGGGDDFINVLDETANDHVDCGGGTFDEVYGDGGDTYDPNCENQFSIIVTKMSSNPQKLGPEELRRLASEK